MPRRMWRAESLEALDRLLAPAQPPERLQQRCALVVGQPVEDVRGLVARGLRLRHARHVLARHPDVGRGGGHQQWIVQLAGRG